MAGLVLQEDNQVFVDLAGLCLIEVVDQRRIQRPPLIFCPVGIIERIECGRTPYLSRKGPNTFRNSSSSSYQNRLPSAADRPEAAPTRTASASRIFSSRNSALLYSDLFIHGTFFSETDYHVIVTNTTY